VFATQALRVASFPNPVFGARTPPAIAGTVVAAALLAVLTDRIFASTKAVTCAAMSSLPCCSDVALLAVLAAAALNRAVFADEVSAAGAAVPVNLVDTFAVLPTWLRRTLVHVSLTALPGESL
jgi:hypothetical protein